MQKGRPKQHIHNWTWRLRFGPWGVKENLFGSHGYKIWYCIRGGNVKHIEREAIFLAASGIIAEPKYRSD